MSDLHKALALAVRHIDDGSTSEADREAVLACVAEHFSGETGETASRSLFHLREQRKLQLTLKAIIEGIGK